MSARILVAEDSHSTRRAMVLAIRAHGFDVVGEAHDGIEAVEMYRELAPDLVLMDIAMPNKHGIDAIADILATDPDAIILAVTALYSPEKRAEIIDVGGKDIISKPFDVPDLIARIRACLAPVA